MTGSEPWRPVSQAWPDTPHAALMEADLFRLAAQPVLLAAYLNNHMERRDAIPRPLYLPDIGRLDLAPAKHAQVRIECAHSLESGTPLHPFVPSSCDRRQAIALDDDAQPVERRNLRAVGVDRLRRGWQTIVSILKGIT